MFGEGSRALHSRVAERLIQESVLAMGRTAPNPAVACVVVTDIRPDGERRLVSGGTERAGGRHAEIAALDAFDALCSAGDKDARVDHLFVTLEPCSRFGRTPPCVDRILAYPHPRRIHIYEPDPSLSQGGINRLREAGARVTLCGPKKRETARAFLGGFLARVSGRGPRLHLKYAVTPGGRMAGSSSERLMISGASARRFTMLLRAKCDAVLVGPGTLALDRPGLEFRRAAGADEAFDGRRNSGADTLVDAMLRWAPEIEDRAEREPEYQPERIFIPGRPPWSSERRNSDAQKTFLEFLERQSAIAERTGRAPRFLMSAEGLSDWPQAVSELRATAGEAGRKVPTALGALEQSVEEARSRGPVLSELRAPGFASELRAALGAMGLNEVMVEGGAGLFEALRGELRTGDRVYELRSRRNFTDEEVGGKRAPDYLQALAPRAEYELGEDTLRVREL